MKKEEKQKSNIEFARDILNDLKSNEHGEDQFHKKLEECFEFLDWAEEDFSGLKDDYNILEQANKELQEEEELPELETDNSDFVGLDTIHWSLQNGNLVIQQRVENFISQLKKENSCTIS